jgi:glycosyltransferase involved in cell wall biosynthesis
MSGKIAIIVQRYGQEVSGGSELLAGDIARCLSKAYDVEILTTCAKDYVTWANYYREGDFVEDGIRVKRFKVDRKRSIFFNIYNMLMLKLPRTLSMEKLWMSLQGPYSSGLLRYIKHNHSTYDAFVFVTYMYATSYYGIKAAYDKAILVPTAHDEPYIRFGIYRELFKSACRIIYLTDEEKAFVDGYFGLAPDKGIVAGMAVGTCEGSPEDFRTKYGIDSDFILYVGRIDTMKGLGQLFEYFKRYRNDRNSSLKLVLCGKGPMKIPDEDHIVATGYVSDPEKYGAMRAAMAVIQPSRYESYSISTIESMQCGTPVIVNGECNVLKAHIEKSSAGFSYTSYEEFKSALDSILSEPSLRQRMGTAGMDYVKCNYSGDAVGRKYISTIDGLVDRK